MKDKTFNLIISTVGAAISAAAIFFLLSPSANAQPTYTPQQEARWACSDAIVARARVPDSVQFVRRSQWPVVEQEGKDGVWIVLADFKASNALGVVIPGQAICHVRKSGARFTARMV